MSFVFVDHGSSLVIGHEGNLQVRFKVASFALDRTLILARLLLLIPSKSMDTVAESVYEPPLANSEPFVLPYDDSAVAVGSLPPDQSFASRIGKTKVYLYSENDAASRFGKVRLQLRRKIR